MLVKYVPSYRKQQSKPGILCAVRGSLREEVSKGNEKCVSILLGSGSHLLGALGARTVISKPPDSEDVAGS